MNAVIVPFVAIDPYVVKSLRQVLNAFWQDVEIADRESTLSFASFIGSSRVLVMLEHRRFDDPFAETASVAAAASLHLPQIKCINSNISVVDIVVSDEHHVLGLRWMLQLVVHQLEKLESLPVVRRREMIDQWRYQFMLAVVLACVCFERPAFSPSEAQDVWAALDNPLRCVTPAKQLCDWYETFGGE